MIVLAKPGKVHAISSITGSVAWSYYVPEKVPLKVFVLNEAPQELRSVSSEGLIGVVFQGEIHYLSPLTGARVHKSQVHIDSTVTDTMLVEAKGSHFIVYITEGALEGKASVGVSMPGLKQLIADGESVFFSKVDKVNKQINGYKILPDLYLNRVWSFKFTNEEFLQIEGQYSTESQIEHDHFVPTAFSEDNIIYKYLDQNMFALATKA